MALEFDEIIGGRLWLGPYPGIEDVAELRQLAITTVVNLQDENDLSHFELSIEDMRRAYGAAGIGLRWFPIGDFDKRELLGKLAGCVAEIEEALAPTAARVYLHCTAGMNRAPTAAAAFLIHSQGMSAREAYDYVLERRYCRPYLDVLTEYASSLPAAPPDR